MIRFFPEFILGPKSRMTDSLALTAVSSVDPYRISMPLLQANPYPSYS
jgi:hypothetical protein